MLSRSTAIAALLVAPLLAACPAQMMGVELPRGGPDTISQEDLQRDAWALLAPPGRAGDALARRLGEMRVLPAYGRAWGQGTGAKLRVCGRKEGTAADAWLLLARGDPSTATGALAWASLISAAKGFDVAAAPARTLLFCAVTSTDGADALVAAPPVPAQRLAGLTVFDGATAAGLVSSSRPGPLSGTAAGVLPPVPDEAIDDIGAVDYRRLADQLRDAVVALQATRVDQP